MKFAVRAAAIDLDGTLLDTLPDITEAAERMLADLGRSPAGHDTVRRYIGNGIARLTKRLLTGTLDREPDAELFARALPLFERHYGDTFRQKSRPFPGVVEGIGRMRDAGLALACVTNKAAAFTLPLLAATGLRDAFALVVSGDTLTRNKPDPLPVLHVAERFGVPPAQVLVIGDSENDAKAARAAGSPVVCVSYGYPGTRPVYELDCDAIVHDLVEAASLIASLGPKIS